MVLPAQTTSFGRVLNFRFYPLLVCFPLAALGLMRSYGSLAIGMDAVPSYPIVVQWTARLTSLCVYAISWIASMRGKRLLPHRGLLTLFGALYLCGMAATFAWSDIMQLYIAAQVLVGIGSAATLMAWAELLGDLPRPERRLTVICGAMATTVLILGFHLLDGWPARALALAIVVGSSVPLAAFGPHRSSLFAPGGAQKGHPAPMATAANQCRQAVSWEFVLLMACYALLYQLMQTLGYQNEAVAPIIKFAVTFIALLALALWLHKCTQGRSSNSKVFVLPLFALSATALILIPFTDSMLRMVAAAVAGSCWPLFYYFLWIILFDLGDNRNCGHMPIFTYGWMILNVFIVFAAPLTSLFNRQMNAGALSLAALVLIVVYTTLVASLLIGRGKKSETEEAELVTSPESSSVESLEKRCTALARLNQLTPRETDVFALLVRGRSVPFISEQLGISQSTTKGHVRHIYEKFEVAGKQELIDLFENAGVPD